jgi:hypothetical protein
MDDDRDMSLEVMKGILGHAKKMRGKALFDKYAPKDEPPAEEMPPVDGEMPPEGEEMKAETKPQLSEEQIAQLIEMLKQGAG